MFYILNCNKIQCLKHFEITLGNFLMAIELFNAQSEKFIAVLREESNKAYTDIVPMMTTLTLNIICETAMGISSASNHETIKEYQEAVHQLGSLLVYRVFRPWLHTDFIYAFTSYGRQQNKLINTLHQFSMNVIKAREETFNEDDVKNMENSDEDHTGIYAKNYAMLDLLLLAKTRGEIDNHGIREEVDTFIFEVSQLVQCYEWYNNLTCSLRKTYR
ncbi:Cytochrome P450 4c3 [Carabus blaptoides fortunei]